MPQVVAIQPSLYEAAPPQAIDQISEQFMLADLARSGLVPEDLSAYPISNVFGVGQYVIPYQVPSMWVKRADTLTDKYRGPKGQTDLYIPPTTYPRSSTLWLIEGEKKSAKFSKHFGIFSAGLRGCRGFSQGSVLHPTLVGLLHNVKQVNVVFDGDIEINVQIQYAATQFASLLKALSVSTAIYKPPFAKGVDDWLVENPQGALEELVPIAVEELQASRKQVLADADIGINENGKFELNVVHAYKILSSLYKERLYVDKRLGTIFAGDLCLDLEKVYFDILCSLQEHIDGKFKPVTIYSALDGYLKTHTSDLVRDAVKAIVWDGIPRLDTWGPDYLKVKPHEKHICEEFGRILLTAFALRITQPGIKCDYAFFLVGPQGVRKTTFLQSLATFDGHELYCPIEVLPTGATPQARHSMVQCASSILVDMAEGVILDSKGASHENIKSYISQTHDTIQVLYKNAPRVEPRGYIICGATNKSDIVSDKSGSRRFINLNVEWCKALPYDFKLQLMAEALATAVLDEANPQVWWKSRITMDDIDPELRAENAHITNPQDLLNLQFSKADDFANDIREMIDGKVFPVLKGYGTQFITTRYIVDKMNGTNRGVTTPNLVSKVLRDLATSPTFPYVLEPTRKRLSQLAMDEWQHKTMSNGITNNDSALPGYIVFHK